MPVPQCVHRNVRFGSHLHALQLRHHFGSCADLLHPLQRLVLHVQHVRLHLSTDCLGGRKQAPAMAHQPGTAQVSRGEDGEDGLQILTEVSLASARCLSCAWQAWEQRSTIMQGA
jgi:hypothetical protein